MYYSVFSLIFSLEAMSYHPHFTDIYNYLDIAWSNEKYQSKTEPPR